MSWDWKCLKANVRGEEIPTLIGKEFYILSSLHPPIFGKCFPRMVIFCESHWLFKRSTKTNKTVRWIKNYSSFWLHFSRQEKDKRFQYFSLPFLCQIEWKGRRQSRNTCGHTKNRPLFSPRWHLHMAHQWTKISKIEQFFELAEIVSVLSENFLCS